MSRRSVLPAALFLALGLGLAGFAEPASAASGSSIMPMASSTAAHADLLQDVRWVQRCRPERVVRRDRRGHRVVVNREVCRRVWR